MDHGLGRLNHSARGALRTLAIRALHYRDAERLIAGHALTAGPWTLDAIQLAVALAGADKGGDHSERQVGDLPHNVL